MRWLFLAMTLVVIVGSARAQPDVDVKRELQAGIDAFRLGKYADARIHLEKARALDRKLGDPHRYLAAVAQAESRWDDCITSAREALLVAPKSKDAAETRKLHAACRASAGRPPYVGQLTDKIAALAVTSNVPLATVKVRGLIFGGTPTAPRSVAPGRVAIDVEKAGYISGHVDIDVLPGIVNDVDVKLESGEENVAVTLARKSGSITLPANLQYDAVIVDGRPVKVPPDRRIELAPGMHVIEVRAAGSDPWRRQIAVTADNVTPLAPAFVDSAPRRKRGRLGVILATGGGMLAAVGVFAFYTSRGASDEARRIAAREIARPIGDTTPPFRTRDDFEDARSRANSWALVSNLAYTAALGVGGVGVYFILKGRAPSADEVPPIAIAPAPGGAIVTRSGSW